MMRRRRKPQPRPRRERPVTVGIAAMCQWANVPYIVGAADRMISAENDTILWEPTQTKIFPVSPDVVILWSGDALDQATLCERTKRAVQSDPSMNVESVAEIYAHQFALLRRQKAEKAILDPVGLDYETFYKQQRSYSPDFVEQVRQDLMSDAWRLSNEAIVTGVDADSSAHIFVVDDPGTVNCFDGLGFAAIGIGAFHAKSQFMFKGHVRWKLLHETMLLTYRAKKRAEVASGVGALTDMVTISRANTPNHTMWLFPEQTPMAPLYSMLTRLEQETQIKENSAWEESVKRLWDEMMEWAKTEQAKAAEQGNEQAPKSESVQPPSDFGEKS
jgi:20S proteasome alpha/beta subunit